MGAVRKAAGRARGRGPRGPVVGGAPGSGPPGPRAPSPTPPPKAALRANARRRRAREIMGMQGFFGQSGDGRFWVRSQSDPGKKYDVSATDGGLVCSCPDHAGRKADCKHIRVVLEMLKANRGFANAEFRVMERSGMRLCKHCDSGRIKRAGVRRTRGGAVQRYACLDCKRRFTLNCGFEKKRFGPETITQAIQMYYQGMSARDVASNFEMVGTDVCHKTVYNWVSEYSRLVGGYLDGVVPRTRDRAVVRADEVWIRVAGEQKYLFASMDDDTRYWLASEMAHTKFQHSADTLLALTKRQMGRSPAHFVTDGLPAYGRSSRRVFGRGTQHHAHVHLRGDMNNNRMERLNGEIRDREKVFRGLKRFDTPLIAGMKAYYNYAKKHGGLGGRTPAEQALIRVDGRNKWIALIQNASLHAMAG